MDQTSATNAISLKALRKSWGADVVLDGIDLEVRKGSIFALLGENGAGKTTTIRILTTLALPESGAAAILGVDVVRDAAQARSLFALAGQFAAVDDLLTGRENLQMMARLRREAKPGAVALDLLERFDLVAAADRQVSTWSGGMRRRLDLAMSVIGEPPVIFLDEPTTGLDPQGRRAIWDLVREMAASGTTVFLTTQYLEEAEALADRVAILKGGRIVAQGSPAELKRGFPGGMVEFSLANEEEWKQTAALFGDQVVQIDEKALALSVSTDGSVGAIKRVLDDLERAQTPLVTLAVRQPTLEEVFVALTATPAKEGSN